MQHPSSAAPEPARPDVVFHACGLTKHHPTGQVVVEALRGVDLQDRMHRFPVRLTGGEPQRIAIARAVAKCPDVLLCDEPIGALDYATGKVVLEVFEAVHREMETTAVLITHSAAIAGMADRVLRMRSVRIVKVTVDSRRLSPGQTEWSGYRGRAEPQAASRHRPHARSFAPRRRGAGTSSGSRSSRGSRNETSSWSIRATGSPTASASA
ncbi:MAG TPA: ATP-binding cassette domain-containing protein [Candidatus Polarisedimenticolia bacterium]|nr:ATP-binding cassette domain-containing protein [Candidatus Polarisedimenticolia bacterium]